MENSEQFDLELEQLKQILRERPVNEPAGDEPQPGQEKPVPVKQQTGEESKQKNKESWQKTVLLYLHDLLYLLAALIVVSLLLFRVVVVSGTSMNTTLLDGDYLLVLSNVFYRQPEYKDIVVISKESFDNGDPIVKRVIATEGQTVDINFTLGIVYVDGEPLYEPYIHTATTTQEGMQFPLTVPEGCVFVLGDNRLVSKDSRDPEIGIVDGREIVGKVIFLFLPGTNKGEYPFDITRIGVVK